jgi:hypothetical protein
MEETLLIKYFTRDLLLAATLEGNKRNYNRQLNPDMVANLEEDMLFPVTFHMLHEHIAGETAEPHIRACVMLNPNEKVLIDVGFKRFSKLPEAEVPA